MKAIAFNGSPHAKGNTYLAIMTVIDELEKAGIATEVIHIGNKAVRGCIACEKCGDNLDCRCVLPGDDVNLWIEKMQEADGVIFGSPVYFAGINATLKAFLDRAFFVSAMNGNIFRHKVGVSLAAVRRSGGIPAIEQINKFINYSEMLMPGSNYWNVAHGLSTGEFSQDAEGVQIMRVLGKNMAWLLKLIEHGKGKIDPPTAEDKTFTNFIR